MSYITIHDGNAPFPMQDLSILLHGDETRSQILDKVGEALDELEDYKNDPDKAQDAFFGDAE